MRTYTEEFQLAAKYSERELKSFPIIKNGQLSIIRREANEMFKWYKQHPYLHNLISVSVIAFLLAMDYFVLRVLPILLPGGLNSNSSLAFKITAALVCGVAHGYVCYNLGVFTIHEGGAHNAIIQGSGPVARFLRFFANNASRLMMADPEFYRKHHIAHHSHFATELDGSFTNFVLPKRYYRSFLPYAFILNFNDFRVHCGVVYTRSRVISLLMGLAYFATYAFFMIPHFGWLFTVLTLGVISIHFAFALDRLREGIEHSLMPLDRANGTRNFGYSFWGLLIGGGPWGQCCHLSHHLAPHLPWYQQLMLHKKLQSILTPEQKDVFFLKPLVGFPSLVGRVFKESARLTVNS